MSDEDAVGAKEERRFEPRPRPATSKERSDVDAAERNAQARLDRTIRELLECIEDGARVAEMGWERLDGDWLVRRAARNVITELGETVKRLPTSFVDQHPDIEWRAIAGMRDRTVHHYQHTDHRIIWATLTIDLPRLRAALDDHQPPSA